MFYGIRFFKSRTMVSSGKLISVYAKDIGPKKLGHDW